MTIERGRGVLLAVSLAATLAITACGGDKPGEAGKDGKPADGKGAAAGKSGSGGKGGPGGGRGPRAFPVEVAPVVALTINSVVHAAGELEPAETIQLASKVAGVVDRVRFREGDSVGRGTVLVEIDADRYRLAAAQAEANVARAAAQEKEIAASLAKREALRAKNAGWVSEEEIGGFRARLDVARSEVAQVRAAARLAQLNLSDAMVRPSEPGIVQKRLVQPGAYVQAGTPLATMVKARPLFLRFKVGEQEAGRLRVGEPVQFGVRADPQGVFRAKLVHVGNSADPQTRMVECLARVDDDAAGLKPGFFADVRVTLAAGRSVPVAPEGAIRATERGFVVYVIEKDTARERVVELGSRTPEGEVEILSGIVPGETLVTRGAQYLKDGATVVISGPAVAPAAEVGGR